jgi:hypothetical protein
MDNHLIQLLSTGEIESIVTVIEKNKSYNKLLDLIDIVINRHIWKQNSSES